MRTQETRERALANYSSMVEMRPSELIDEMKEGPLQNKLGRFINCLNFEYVLQLTYRSISKG